MDHLAQQESQKYQILWNSFPEYRKVSPADSLTQVFLDSFQNSIQKGDSVIDFGCGTGRSAPHLLKADLKIQMVDFCDNCLDVEIFLQSVGPNPALRFIQGCLWNLPQHLEVADWMICFDVIEHIPEEMVDASLKEMASRMKKGGLLSIALIDDGFGRAINQKLHLTVKSADWWKERVSRYFLLQEELTNPDDYLVLSIGTKE